MSLKISLEGKNRDSPSAQDCNKGTDTQDISWAVGLTDLYPLPADFHHVPEGPISEKKLGLERKQTTAFPCVGNRKFSLPGTSEVGTDYPDPQLLIRRDKR